MVKITSLCPFIDSEDDLADLVQQLRHNGYGQFSITSGSADNDWFPGSTLYPEGLFLDAPKESRDVFLSVIYDYFMIGTIYHKLYSHQDWYYYPIHPCTYFYSQLYHLFFEGERSSFIYAMLDSPFTSLSRNQYSIDDLAITTNQTSTHASFIYVHKTNKEMIPIHHSLHQSVKGKNMDKLVTIQISIWN